MFYVVVLLQEIARLLVYLVRKCCSLMSMALGQCQWEPYAHWFTPNDQVFLPLKCSLQYLLERHMFGAILTSTNSVKGAHYRFLVKGVGLGLAAKISPPNIALKMATAFLAEEKNVFGFIHD